MTAISTNLRFKEDCKKFQDAISRLSLEEQAKAKRIYTKFLETAEKLDRSVETLSFSGSVSYSAHKELSSTLINLKEELEKMTKKSSF